MLGAALANAWGVIGGSMHIVMHAFGKIIQNANNSVRVTDAFMEAVVEGKEWNLTARTDGSRRPAPSPRATS